MSKTKWKLAEALKKLMKEKSLHKITIQDIVEESGLTRQSFYYHFHDICEIIEWICKNTLLEKCDVEEKRRIVGSIHFLKMHMQTEIFTGK